ncbi:hypothetical protein [Agrobacterium pusense]|uniref:hypothetical protein n=1 Tax=Agrobacterium pusense TaxID=648995 RepID=UPI0032DB22D0
MSKDQKARLWVLAVLVVVTALLVPIFLAEPSSIFDQAAGGGWRDIIYDFQTLFTGILAIGAAAFTIIQSRIIEERQQIRHEQLFDLQVRPDKLRVSRAYAHVDVIRTQRRHFPEWDDEALIKNFQKDGEFTNFQRGQIAALRTFCQIIKVELLQPPLEQSRDLFDGKLHTMHSSLMFNLERLENALQHLDVPNNAVMHVGSGENKKDIGTMTVGKKNQMLMSAMFYKQPFFRGLDEFVAGFESLAREYKVVRVLNFD